MPRTSRRHSRAAYTLVELLLALGLLAVLVAITAPSALRIFATTQIMEAAEPVRAQLAGTRVRAIESGLVYQFRFEPDGGQYISVPFEQEIEGSDSRASGTGATTGVGTFTRFSGKLPAGCTFFACCTSTNASGGKLGEGSFGELPDADDLSGVSWSAPILFHPDGSSADAAFEVRDSQGQLVRFDVRGLTGGVTMGRPTQGSRE